MAVERRTEEKFRYYLRRVQLLIRLKRKIPSENMKFTSQMKSCLVSHDFIIAVFCCVDDLSNQLTQGRKIRKGGFAPSVSDSEIITMEIVGEFLGIEADQGIWHYF